MDMNIGKLLYYCYILDIELWELGLLSENTIIRRKEVDICELIALNKSTVDAINTPISEYTKYSL